jgi:site-specific DNA-cytosine methylase
MGGERAGADPRRGRASGPDGDCDLVCGGFPCQDLSVAGRRAGLAGERSGLFFEFARVADAVLSDGGWVLIENVPGLLSSHGGRDFAVLLATLGDLGFHDLAWRVLDSRYFGVPQRRRRVFILARRSRGRRASEVLLEPESGGGDFEAGRAERESVAGSLEGESGKSGGADDNDAQGNRLGALTSRQKRLDAEDTYIIGSPDAFDQERAGGQRSGPDRLDESERGDDGRGTPPHPDRVRAPAELPRGLDGAFHATQEPIYEPNGTPALGANVYLATGATGATGATCAHDPRPDGPRYAAMGDAVTVNVAEWIGRRLSGGDEDG